MNLCQYCGAPTALMTYGSNTGTLNDLMSLTRERCMCRLNLGKGEDLLRKIDEYFLKYVEKNFPSGVTRVDVMEIASLLPQGDPLRSEFYQMIQYRQRVMDRVEILRKHKAESPDEINVSEDDSVVFDREKFLESRRDSNKGSLSNFLHNRFGKTKRRK